MGLSFFSSEQESVRTPRVLVGFGLVAVSSPLPPSLWKCGNPRLVRFPSPGGNKSSAKMPPWVPPSVISTASWNFAHFGANVVVGGYATPKRAFPETRTE
jgi:hypothetical protein